MKDIIVWHCYHYTLHDTYVVLAESEAALKAKIWDEIKAGWYPEDDGPLPEDFDTALELYAERADYHGCYFGDIGWSVVDSTLCEPAEADQ